MLDIQSDSSSQRPPLTAIECDCMGRFYRLYVTHVQCNSVVCAIYRQANFVAFDIQNSVELAIEDAIISRTTNHMQAKKQPKPLTVRLMVGVNPNSTLSLCNALLIRLLIWQRW